MSLFPEFPPVGEVCPVEPFEETVRCEPETVPDFVSESLCALSFVTADAGKELAATSLWLHSGEWSP